MIKKFKDIETSCKSMGAAMFMFNVCIYMAVRTLSAAFLNIKIYYQIPFAFIIHGIIISMISSALWFLFFGFIKQWCFLPRYLLTLLVLVAFFGLSALIPVINSNAGYYHWIISGFASVFLMGTAFSVANEKTYKNTGKRIVLIWELLK